MSPASNKLHCMIYVLNIHIKYNVKFCCLPGIFARLQMTLLTHYPFNLSSVLVFCCFCNNYYKLSGIKQHKFITLYLCGSEAPHVSPRLKINVLTGKHSFLETLVENLLTCLFQLLGIPHFPCLVAPFLHFKASNVASLWPLFFSHTSLLLIVTGSFSTFKNSCD